MYARALQNQIEALLAEFRIVYLTGPRQAGKTTVVREIAERTKMRFISLDDQAILSSVKSDPHGFIRSLGNNAVVLDEFQYAPGLIPAIKEASDKLKPTEKGRFLLTGSSDIFRSARAQEALPGHMARLELYPLSLSERLSNSASSNRTTAKKQTKAVNLIDYLVAGEFQSTPLPTTHREQIAGWVLHGGYPEAVDKSPRARQVWFKSYLEGRLLKDFESMHIARGDYFSKLQAMIPFLAGLSGNLLKYASVANDLELNDKLVKTYIEILELMFIIKRVPAYLKNRAKRAAQMPKLHFVDTGLACYLLGIRNEEQLLKSQFYGGLLETLVYMECCKHIPWAQDDVSLYHFRDNRQHEVDIVLERSDTKIIGIEVKASASLKVQDFNGLAALAEFAGASFAQGVLFYTGSDVLPFKLGKLTFYALPLSLLIR